MTNAVAHLPKVAPKRFTRTEVKLNDHTIEYVGLNREEAVTAAREARLSGLEVTFTRARVTGSRLSDPHPYHYTVVSFAK